MEQLKLAALGYLERGWSIFPLNGKIARIAWREWQSKLPSREQVEQWWTEWPDAWIGCALGSVSGIVRVDADGQTAINDLQSRGGLPKTAEFKTKSGGRGWLLRHMDGVTTKQLWKGKGEHEELKVQSDGAYTVLPPSPGYEWLSEERPATLPKWLYDWYVERALSDLVQELRPTLRQPERSEIAEALNFVCADEYDRWVQVGMALKATDESYFDLWENWSKKSSKFQEGACSTKWTTFRSGVRDGLTARSILFWAEQEGGWKPPNRHEPLTDLGNARVLARMGEGVIKHSSVWGWLWWDDKRWANEGAEKRVVELQKQVLEHRITRAIESLARHLKTDPQAPDFERRRKQKVRTISSIRSQEDERHIRGARTLAESEPTLSCEYRTFDQQPYLLNCANGTLDLRTCQLRDYDPWDNLTQLCPVAYKPEAEAPRWQRFLAEVFDGDKELIDWVQRFFGYCCTGSVQEHVLPIFHGNGRNGKSTLIKAVMSVLGPDYSTSTPSGFLVQSKNEQHPTKLAVLYGKRFCADLETGDGARLNEELIKRLTGGDEMSCRRLYEDFWTFVPTHKLVLCTNYEPKVKGTDLAIWSRIRLIPFNQTFDGTKADRRLEEALRMEAEGILRWLIDGCILWQSLGLGSIDRISVATASYKHEQNTVAQFFAERCEVAEGNKMRKSDVVSAYKSWCYANSAEPVSAKAFGTAMLELGIKSDPSLKYYVGIRV